MKYRQDRQTDRTDRQGFSIVLNECVNGTHNVQYESMSYKCVRADYDMACQLRVIL
jgi:hypothetical protein